MLGMKIRDDQIEAMVAEIDVDGSGEVDFNEFLLVMSKREAYNLERLKRSKHFFKKIYFYF